MPVLQENVKEEVRGVFKDLNESVKLIVFTREPAIATPGSECPTCKDNRLLIEEVASLSDKISVETYDFSKDKEKVEYYKIDKIPATIVLGKKDYGIRIYGIPAGYEFATLLNAIKIVSTSNSDLTPASKEQLRSLAKPVHIQVFVTLSCPYCSSAVATAHQMAMESDNIKADMINAQEFPDLAQRYNVFSVPKIVINENIQFEGALPEDAYLEKVMEAVK